MIKNTTICLLVALALVLLWQFTVVELHVYRTKGKVETVILLNQAGLNSTNPVDVVGNIDAILWLTPERDGKSRDPEFGILLDNFFDRALMSLVEHLKNLTGRNLGNDPRVWVQAYKKQKIQTDSPTQREKQ